jgi:hypothetical protein
MRLDDGEQIEGAAGEAVTSPGASLPSIRQSSRRSGHRLAVDVGASRRPKLLKLAVEGLPVGADAGIADEPFIR